MRMNASHPDAKRIKVLCDGIELQECIAADDEDGTATVYKTDEHGRIVMAPIGYGSPEPVPVTEVVKGHIEFRPMAPEHWFRVPPLGAEK
jgi:hypothetical protein